MARQTLACAIFLVAALPSAAEPLCARQHGEALRKLGRMGCFVDALALGERPPKRKTRIAQVSLAFQRYAKLAAELRELRAHSDFVQGTLGDLASFSPARPDELHNARAAIFNMMSRMAPRPDIPTEPDALRSLINQFALEHFEDRWFEFADMERELAALRADPWLYNLARYSNLSYIARFETKTCEGDHGMWGVPTRQARQHKYQTVGKMLGIQLGDLVLDLGSGCGEQAEELHKQFGACIISQDLSLSNVEHMLPMLTGGSLLAVCPGDAKSFLFESPKADVILANGVVNIFPGTARCQIVKRIASLLQPNGRAWFGYNDFDQDWWHDCQLSMGTVDTVLELDLFNGTVEYAFEASTHTAFLFKRHS